MFIVIEIVSNKMGVVTTIAPVATKKRIVLLQVLTGKIS